MLRREEQLRTSEEGLQRMKAAAEWLDGAEDMQRQVVSEFGLHPTFGLSVLRSATQRFPELREIAVYVRNNIARVGLLQVGDIGDDVPLIALEKQAAPHAIEIAPGTSLHALVAGASLTVLCAGSLT
eukprot:TRINITY_DN9851_c0_g1_i2.p1 TRINITY_DN9851_c0_g1~~TRINITY_DN9851_c0_g1_i2.p1  ORF type:complete len:127 (-),score=30.31 TRINITY_DN9851_c0_g1_i2:659-1039(-)